MVSIVGTGMTAFADSLGETGAGVGWYEGGLVLLALLALVTLRVAVKIIPEWIESFHQHAERPVLDGDRKTTAAPGRRDGLTL
jgi:hypothetical protein